MIEKSKEISVGDVVVLESGSSDLTITALSADKTQADVVWFMGGAVHKAFLPVASLKVVRQKER